MPARIGRSACSSNPTGERYTVELVLVIVIVRSTALTRYYFHREVPGFCRKLATIGRWLVFCFIKISCVAYSMLYRTSCGALALCLGGVRMHEKSVGP